MIIFGIHNENFRTIKSILHFTTAQIHQRIKGFGRPHSLIYEGLANNQKIREETKIGRVHGIADFLGPPKSMRVARRHELMSSIDLKPSGDWCSKKCAARQSKKLRVR